MPNIGKRLRQGVAQESTAVTIALQEMKRHALRRLRADPWQATQRFDEPGECRRVLQKGNFMPAGKFSPDIMPAYFS